MRSKIWSLEDDLKLWSLRSKSISELAPIFNRTMGSIRSRLKHLNNPNHKAYHRVRIAMNNHTLITPY